MEKKSLITLLLGLVIGFAIYLTFKNELRGVIEYARSSLITQKQIPVAKNATIVQPWAQIKLKKVLSATKAPVYLTNAGDGSRRIFIVEKKGQIKVFEQDLNSYRTFLDIGNRVRAREYERGLLSVAFHPKFKDNGRFFVYYTNLKGDVVVSEFNINKANNLGNKNSEKILLEIQQPYSNHNGGQLKFGPDGYLYIGTGDGGALSDPFENAQNLQTLLGKILRVDVNSKKPYEVPHSNPFTKRSNSRSEIWSYGLRNPWRFSFDSRTGDMFIADVGENEREEINFQSSKSKGGENYGWDLLEGFNSFELPANFDLSKLTMPISEYSHDVGCSVTGGYVYRGKKFKKLNGTYFYADFCSGTIWGLRKKGNEWQNAEFLKTPHLISSFGVDEDGGVYILDYNAGSIFRLEVDE